MCRPVPPAGAAARRHGGRRSVRPQPAARVVLDPRFPPPWRRPPCPLLDAAVLLRGPSSHGEGARPPAPAGSLPGEAVQTPAGRPHAGQGRPPAQQQAQQQADRQLPPRRPSHATRQPTCGPSSPSPAWPRPCCCTCWRLGAWRRRAPRPAPAQPSSTPGSPTRPRSCAQPCNAWLGAGWGSARRRVPRAGGAGRLPLRHWPRRRPCPPPSCPANTQPCRLFYTAQLLWIVMRAAIGAAFAAATPT